MFLVSGERAPPVAAPRIVGVILGTQLWRWSATGQKNVTDLKQLPTYDHSIMQVCISHHLCFERDLFLCIFERERDLDRERHNL